MNTRIGGALILGVALVAVALYVRTQQVDKSISEVSVVPTDNTASEYVATGTDDWENLLRTRMEREDEVAVTEDFDIDNTVTGTFARTFFENYLLLSAQGELSTEEENALIESSLSSLQSEGTDRVYTINDIPHTTTPSDAYLRTYGNALAITMRAHPDPSENELVVFQRAVESNNPDDLLPLAAHEAMYNGVLTDILSIQAPVELQNEHLVIVNATLALRNNVRGMQQFFDDPLYATLRVQRYTTDLEAVYGAIRDIYSYLKDRGIRYTEGEPAAIINVE